MKKITGVLLLSLCVSLISNAQDNGKFRFGFKLEPNVSWLSPKDRNLESTGSSVRFSYGLIADIMFTDNYAIGTGLSVMSNGGEVEYLGEYTSNSLIYVTRTRRDYNAKYVEVPLTLKMRTNEIGYMTYWFQFGLGLAVNVDGKADEEVEFLYQKTDLGWSNEPSEVELPSTIINDNEPLSNDLRTFRTSLVIGAGIEYNLSGSTGIVAGITFNNGFSNVLKGEGVKQDDAGNPVFEDGEPDTFDLRAVSNHLSLTIGVLF